MMRYDPKKEGPRITIVNGHEIFERPGGGYIVLTNQGPVAELAFENLNEATTYALTLTLASRENAPGPKYKRD